MKFQFSCVVPVACAWSGSGARAHVAGGVRRGHSLDTFVIHSWTRLHRTTLNRTSHNLRRRFPNKPQRSTLSLVQRSSFLCRALPQSFTFYTLGDRRVPIEHCLVQLAAWSTFHSSSIQVLRLDTLDESSGAHEDGEAVSELTLLARRHHDVPHRRPMRQFAGPSKAIEWLVFLRPRRW